MFRIFFIFFLLGGQEGGVRGARKEGGVGFLLRGWEAVCGEFGGGEAKFFFFSGPKCPQQGRKGGKAHRKANKGRSVASRKVDGAMRKSPCGASPIYSHDSLGRTESAILNRESGDSESCDSNRAIPRSR